MEAPADRYVSSFSAAVVMANFGHPGELESVIGCGLLPEMVKVRLFLPDLHH
jgi:hypothetical protein